MKYLWTPFVRLHGRRSVLDERLQVGNHFIVDENLVPALNEGLGRLPELGRALHHLGDQLYGAFSVISCE